MSPILISKSSKKDIKTTESFLEAAEFILSGRDIKELDIKDPIRVLYNKIIWDSDFIIYPKESGIEVRYKLLQILFSNCSGRWVKVINTASAMESQICDPYKSYLSYSPEIARALDNLMLGE